MAQAIFTNNIVDFSLVGGGFTNADIVNRGTSLIPGKTPPLNGPDELVKLSDGSSNPHVYKIDTISPPGSGFQMNEEVTAAGPDGSGILTLTGNNSAVLVTYKDEELSK
jgi:hypothetical protein